MVGNGGRLSGSFLYMLGTRNIDLSGRAWFKLAGTGIRNVVAARVRLYDASRRKHIKQLSMCKGISLH
jgi:hypothetical protein